MRVAHVLLRRQLGALRLAQPHGRLVRLEARDRPRLARLPDDVDGLADSDRHGEEVALFVKGD